MRGLIIKTLLAVFAHPDDETFGPGGTLALYVRRGAAVHLLCATRGEVGEAPEGLHGYASKAEMREAELRCASEALGLTSVRYLGYRDSGMPGSPDNEHPQATVAAPQAEVARNIASHVRELKPQVVVTFDPIGGYRHPDHIAVQRATREAFGIAGDASVVLDALPPFAPQKLYYHTFPRGMLRMAVRVLRLLRQDPTRFGQNRDIDLTTLAAENFPIHAIIDIRSVLAVKTRASACHASQNAGMPRGPAALLLQLFAAHEHFMRAIPEQPPGKMEHDLFEGVKD